MFFTILSTIEDEDDYSAASPVKTIYDTYSIRMKSYAYSILKNDFDAEDAVQDTFIKIVKNAERFDMLSEEETERLAMVYLRNTAINIYRKNRSNDEKNSSLDNMEEEIISEDNVWEYVVHKELTEILNKVIDQISPDYRDFLVLFYNYGHTIAEIAEIFGITESNAKMKLMRARKALRKKWKEENREEFECQEEADEN